MSEAKTNTRDRILETCRGLFNERGPAEVTTAEIAEATAISEGNLHYHFRRKEQIVTALFDQFEAALERAGAADEAIRHHPDLQRQYLSGWFNMMWEWRMFYASGIYRLVPVLQPKLMVLTDRGQAHVRRVLNELVEDGRLTARPADIDRLVVNAWIIAGYWIDYLRSRQGVQTITREHLRWGFAQVEALFVPYTVAKKDAPF
jgi:AcrR family transcriptional regulator